LANILLAAAPLRYFLRRMHNPPVTSLLTLPHHIRSKIFRLTLGPSQTVVIEPVPSLAEGMRTTTPHVIDTLRPFTAQSSMWKDGLRLFPTLNTFVFRYTLQSVDLHQPLQWLEYCPEALEQYSVIDNFLTSVKLELLCPPTRLSGEGATGDFA
jgi:hypothetical protein